MDHFQAHLEFILTMLPSGQGRAHPDHPSRKFEPLKTLFDGPKAPCTHSTGCLTESLDPALWCLLKTSIVSKTMWNGSNPFLIGNICLEELHLIQGV